MSTIKDIEKMTGLSKGTISKYMNGGSVRPQNRRLIEEAVKALDYHPNENARIVRGGSRKAVAIVIPNVSVDYCRRVFLTSQHLLFEYGYAVALFNYIDDPEKENWAVNKVLDNNFCAIISISANPGAECYKRAMRQSVDVLFIGRKYIPGAHNIILNDDIAVTDILTRLREYGHTRVGSIVSPTENRIITDAPGKKCFFERCGLTPYPELKYLGSGPALDIGYNGAKHLLSLDDPPTAITCLNGEILLGAKVALLEAGLRVPEDISVVGMLSAFSADSPVLSDFTCVCYPIIEALETAISMLLRAVGGKSSKEKDLRSEEYISAEFTVPVRWAESASVPRNRTS